MSEETQDSITLKARIDRIDAEAREMMQKVTKAGDVPLLDNGAHFMVGFLEGRVAAQEEQIEALKAELQALQRAKLDLENHLVPVEELLQKAGTVCGGWNTTYILPEVAWFQFRSMPNRRDRLVIGALEGAKARTRDLLVLEGTTEDKVQFMQKLRRYLVDHGVLL